MATKKRKRSNCRTPYLISEAGHLLSTEHDRDAGSYLATEAKKQKRRRQKKGCLNGAPGTFRLTEKQKQKLPVKLQKAIIEYHRRKGDRIL